MRDLRRHVDERPFLGSGRAVPHDGGTVGVAEDVCHTEHYARAVRECQAPPSRHGKAPAMSFSSIAGRLNLYAGDGG